MAAKKTPAQRVKDNLALAASEQAKGNAAAASAYAQAAANIKGAGQAKVQAVATQYAALAKVPVQPEQPVTTPTVPTVINNNYAPQDNTAQNLYFDNLNAQSREGASTFLRGILSQYGLGSLASSVDSLVTQWGNNTGVIAEKLKETDPYKTRFKGLLDLTARGVTDVRNESEYLSLETAYRGVFRDSGIQSFLGDAGSASEQAKIADIVGNYSLSVSEVRDRVLDAQRVVAETPQEVLDSLQQYYNVPAATLVQYVLDPTRTKNSINQMANASIAGGYATRAGLNLDASTAGQVAGLAGNNDISVNQLSSDLAKTREIRDATVRLANLENSTLTDSEIAQSTFDTDPNATKKVNALQSRERARFGGSGSVTTGSLSRQRGI